MKKHFNLTEWALLLLALGLFMMPRAGSAQSTTTTLNLGDVLPDVSGQTPSGGSLRLSDVIAAKASVVVFSFSKTAGKDARLWNDHLFKDYGSNRLVAVSTVIMLEAVPRLLRGIIVSELKSNLPPSMRDTTIVSYQNEDVWKQRLAVADESHAYVLVLGPDGHLRWRNSGALNEAQYTELKNKVQEQLH
jgi:ATP10 protein